MRFLFKVSMPVEAGNVAAKSGFSAIQSILAQQKPEAAYFVTEGGKRTAILIIHMDDLSQLPAIAEPWFLALNRSRDCRFSTISRAFRYSRESSSSPTPPRLVDHCHTSSPRRDRYSIWSPSRPDLRKRSESPLSKKLFTGAGHWFGWAAA